MRPLDELRRDLKLALAARLASDPELIDQAVYEATLGWHATRENTPSVREHPLAEPRPYGHQLHVITDWVPETRAEAAEREARADASAWVYGDQDGPPPERVRILDLLDQRTWWRARVGEWTQRAEALQMRQTEPVRVADMTLDHQVRLLALLRRNARNLHFQYGSRLLGAPDDVVWSHDAENPREWLEEQPLIRELVWRTTPWAESPLTWRPLKEAKSDVLLIVRRHGRDEQIWARRIDFEWWQIVEDGYTRVPPDWIRETGTEWRWPWQEEAEEAGVLDPTLGGHIMSPPPFECPHGRGDDCLLCEDGDDPDSGDDRDYDDYSRTSLGFTRGDGAPY